MCILCMRTHTYCYQMADACGTCVHYRTLERTNILGIFNLVVKALIETSMKQGKTLNDEHPQLLQCLIAMEQALKHRLKSKRAGTSC